MTDRDILTGPQSKWKEFFLPKWQKRRWTARMIFLLSVAVFSAVDSFFIPISRDLDPGSAGEGMLFLILGFRALSRSELPILVLASGTCLAVLASCFNHGIVRAGMAWMWLMVPLLFVVLFWGRGKRKQTERT
jgi:hypothetical protein